jgi:tetratricopeptide (TPR) repeat protein
MSYRDDYILRMIQQLGAIVRYALGLSLDGKDEMALIAIDQAFRERLGTGVDTIARHSSSQVLALVRFSASEFWREEAAFIAALLDAEAEIYGRRNSADTAAERRLLALDLLLASRIDAEIPAPDFAPTVEELVDGLRDYHLPPETLAALLRYYEQEGAYARAEDTLFTLIADEPDNEERIALGVALFERLATLDAAALAQGGLSHEEVGHALVQLRA